MMRNLLLLTALLFAGGAWAGTLAERELIRQARLAQNAAIIAHRVDEIAAYWTEDVTICRALGAQERGKAAYRALFEADDPKSPDTVVYVRTPREIEVAAPWDLAFETGTWEGHRGGAQGEVIIRGRYSAQWVKGADRWLIRSEVFVALSGAGPGLKLKAVSAP